MLNAIVVVALWSVSVVDFHGECLSFRFADWF